MFFRVLTSCLIVEKSSHQNSVKFVLYDEFVIFRARFSRLNHKLILIPLSVKFNKRWIMKVLFVAWLGFEIGK